MQIGINNNQKGDPAIKLQYLNVNLYSLHIELSGGASWFYDVFVDLFHSTIQGKFEEAIGNTINNAFSEINSKYIETLPVTMNIADGIAINYGVLPYAYNPYIRFCLCVVMTL
jgi:lipopolysaccharide-binding protein